MQHRVEAITTRSKDASRVEAIAIRLEAIPIGLFIQVSHPPFLIAVATPQVKDPSGQHYWWNTQTNQACD